ncbi:MAG: hypothetical protein K6C05_03795 [Anaerovibrio sp.]|uniref:hypothetical protein n=1 Tax=Anaerovibrio sp. TaxID=1872532 RepID=UPI0025CCAD36|nr:hypothetical protein [Anaerovibrio sp.]MCR5175954.1 hypothetical protein [Anaerovibrio sp.]
MGIKGAVIIGILLELLLGAAAAAFYFMYYIHTPTYSINALQKAVQVGNVEEFQKYVDMDAILKKSSADLENIITDNSAMRKKLQDGSFASVCKEDMLYFVANGGWKRSDEITEDVEFQNKIGLKTMSFRRIEYVVRDEAPESEDEENTAEAAEADSDGDKAVTEGATATVGIRVYEPNYGDTFVLKFKMRQMADQSWQLYDILNYGDFVNALMKQNERDMKRYVEKVRVILKNTEDKFAKLKTKMPEINKEWIIESQKIMKESCEELDTLKVPVEAAKLNSLLIERKAIFYDMMDAYYESLSFQEKVKDYKEAAEKAAQAAAKAGKKQKKSRQPNFDSAAAKLDGEIAEVNKKWADNKAEITKIIGSTDKTVARGVRAMRNNDDDAVRRANYPGADTAGDGDGVNPLRPETLPEISAIK